jgi:hypothetical protein
MKIRPLITTISILLCNAVNAQVTYTANDFAHLAAYTGYFQYGSNMGYYGPSWDDKSLADISAGNPSKNVKGAGIKTLRLFLPEDFLETWGYDIRIDAFNHYSTLGLSENVIALEQPSPAHTDPNAYAACADQSRMFKNLYAPIWDGGANGTSINDTNYFAAYVYKTVSRYKNKTRFWEIVNEPDLDYVGHSEQQPGQAGNWWDNNPPPCELAALKAPIFHYIRMLRVAYDVIKTLDPTAYIAPGGLGHPSFLDAILRNTDNPVDGTVTAQYPLKGGAYFDVMSFHSYPSYSLKSWDNTIMGFVYRRHSDAATDEYLAKMNSMKQVLVNRGYNGTTYPNKIFICTESNIGRIPFADAAGVSMIGSDLAQKNYNMKALVLSQKNDIVQFYSFVLGDTRFDYNATNELEVMGIYKNLQDIGPMFNGGVYNQQLNNEGIAYKTTSGLLRNRKYDATRTAALNLPSNIDGAAFKDVAGTYAYVLWAKTTLDLSEAAAATYTFPAAIFPPPQLIKYDWDYSVTGTTTSVSSTNVAVTGTPIFLFEDLQLVNLHDDSTIRNRPTENDFKLVITPNPASSVASIDFTLKRPADVSIRVIDANGKCVSIPMQGTRFTSGAHRIQFPAVSRLGTGLYYVRFETEITSVIKKLVIAR